MEQSYGQVQTTAWDRSDDNPPRRLDSGYPYQGGQIADGTPGYTLDIPQRGVDLSDLDRVWLNDGFTMYWMYTPPVVPGSQSKPVPIAKRDWDIVIKGEDPYWVAWGTLIPGSPTVFHSLGSLITWPSHPTWNGVTGH